MSAVGYQREAANILSNAQAQTSLLSHILRTNDPPSGLDLKQISPLLRLIESQVARFTPRDLDPMFKATIYDPLESLRAGLRGAASPLRRVPSEIISQIFSKCLFYDSGDDEGTSWNTLDVTEAPWTLARVSRRWREIALRDQNLWSCISVDSWSLAIAGKPEPTMPILIACLARSGEHPLSIHFTDRYPSTFGSKALFVRLFAYAERWTYLKLAASFKYLELITPLKGRLLQLQKLIIEADGPRTPFDIFDTFEVAPKLRTASITIDDPYKHTSRPTIADSDVPYFIKLPWEQLTSLNVDALEVVNHAPQLLNCGLFLTSFMHLPEKYSLIHPARMRTLVINYTFVLNHLEIPSLESLHIIGDGSLAALSEIVTFVSRSSCSLTTLVLSGTSIEIASDLQLLLQLIPSLRSFEISHGLVMWNTVARTLTISPQSRLVPNLRNIVFSFGKTLPHRYDVDPEALLRMLESRRNFNMSDDEDIKQLESVTLLATTPRLLAQLKPRLLILEKLGLKITHGD